MEEPVPSRESALTVSDKSRIVFAHNGKWLHPLFELADFLARNPMPVSDLKLTDKIAGKAAAFLIVRLGIPMVHIRLISQGALRVFERFGWRVTFDQAVEQIQCKTEELVSSNDDPEKVWQMLRRRAGRVTGVDLQIENLRVVREGRKILDGVQLEVKRGDHIIIKGPNGSGKTTLLKSVLGLIPVQSGQILVGGLPVGSPEWKKKRNITGYVNQNRVKGNFPISAFEVVETGLAAQRYSASEHRHRIEIAMRRTGCFDLSGRMFHSLSGGEQQRISIARCLCQEAGLLLFDEPTSFLDRPARDALKNLLLELWSNEAPTVVIVSHDESWCSQFDWPGFEIYDGLLKPVQL